jgi:Asp-tRNA(Asn)/Glu-tRNA(Gln) amidotransferase C subunit
MYVATDKIIYKGDTLPLIYGSFGVYSDKNRISHQKMFGSSESYHGQYVATWEIINNELYLLQIRNDYYSHDWQNVPAEHRIEPKNAGKKYADLKALFPDKYKNGKVLADWVPGDRYIPFGNFLMCFDNDLCAWEFEYKFSIQKGRLEKVEKLDNRKSRETVFSESMRGQSDSIVNYIQSKIEWNHLPVLPIDSVVRVRLAFSADENGIIDNVDILIPNVTNIFTDEAIRILKTIPWSIQYLHGKPMRRYWHIPILFNRPLNKDEIVQLNVRDSLITHYSEEQKAQVIKQRENISDSIKVLFYNESREKNLRSYVFSYTFIDYTFGNKYVESLLKKNKNIVPTIRQYNQEMVEHLKRLSSEGEHAEIYKEQYEKINKYNPLYRHEMICKSISSCWHPLTCYDGSFYNYIGDMDAGCIITDTALYKPNLFYGEMPIKKFTFAEDQHLIFTYVHQDKEQILDVYFVDESHQLAVFKFSEQKYPQLYVDCNLINQIPIITYSSLNGSAVKTILATTDAGNDLPEDVDLFCKTVKKILKSHPLKKNP